MTDLVRIQLIAVAAVVAALVAAALGPSQMYVAYPWSQPLRRPVAFVMGGSKPPDLPRPLAVMLWVALTVLSVVELVEDAPALQYLSTLGPYAVAGMVPHALMLLGAGLWAAAVVRDRRRGGDDPDLAPA